MTEHSVEELERQHQAATDRWRQADLDMRAAGERLQAARNEASGLVGHVLEYTVYQGFGTTARHVKRRLLVKNIRKIPNGTLYAYGTLIVATGKLGLRGDHVDISKATDTGVYQPPGPIAIKAGA